MSHLSHLSQVDRVSFVIFSDRVYQRFASTGGYTGGSCSRRGPAAASARGLRLAAKHALLPPVRPPPLRAARDPRRLAQAKFTPRSPRSRGVLGPAG